MADQAQETEYLKHLREEKFNAQEARTTYTLKKLAYATALMGLSSLNIQLGQIDTSFLIYLVPWVSIAFDFYIMAEDYSVKRIGAFLGAKSSTSSEKNWEQWVALNRDPFAPWAMPILTTLILIGSTAIAIEGFVAAQQPLFWIWLVTTGLLTWILFVFYFYLRKHALKSMSRIDNKESLQQIVPWHNLITAVNEADYQLNRSTYAMVQQFFIDCSNDPSCLQATKLAAPEYGQSEFLLCVDSQGKYVPLEKGILQDFRQTVERHPEYQLWFREANMSENGDAVLLVARWLCHLVGFRHVTIHLFIDHPTYADHTLVQVRAIDKAESPGCFDLPVAGHVANTDSIELTLRKELTEELHLELDALQSLTELSSYQYTQSTDSVNFCNTEHRVVFRGRLKEDSWLTISASAQEVAAITVFPIAKLNEMMTSFPMSVASGLKGSFPIYLKTKLDDLKYL